MIASKKNRAKPGEETQQGVAIIRCAYFILPLLNQVELSSISLTCKTLNRIAKSITAARSSDACRQLEKIQIPFVNSGVDNHPYAYFVYTPAQTLAEQADLLRQPWGSDYDCRPQLNPVFHPPTVEDGCGCECERCDVGCPCSGSRCPGLIWECGSSCSCGLECANRVTQRGVSVRLKIVRSRRKGWGLHADQFIRRGEFVCQYAGELLTVKEARWRQLTYDKLASTGRFSSALLVVREHLPSGNACMRINIDATRIGNVARFINHSCDGGNLLTVLARSSAALLPCVCFVASRDILQDDELSFSYGDVSLNPQGLQCFCASSCCSGVLPSEPT